MVCVNGNWGFILEKDAKRLILNINIIRTNYKNDWYISPVIFIVYI